MSVAGSAVSESAGSAELEGFRIGRYAFEILKGEQNISKF
jgi:hypothetical protein